MLEGDLLLGTAKRRRPSRLLRLNVNWVVLAINIASLFGLTHWLTRSIAIEGGAGQGGAFQKSLAGSIEVRKDLEINSMAN